MMSKTLRGCPPKFSLRLFGATDGDEEGIGNIERSLWWRDLYSRSSSVFR